MWDISPVVEGDPDLFSSVIDAMASFFRADPPDTVMCIEAWGFIFGGPIAYLLGARLCVARRPGKLPRRGYVRDLRHVLCAKSGARYPRG
jgi:adenine phosphoribosyltransferase